MLIIDDIDPVVSVHHRLLLLLRVINYQQRRTNDAVSLRATSQHFPSPRFLAGETPNSARWLASDSSW